MAEDPKRVVIVEPARGHLAPPLPSIGPPEPKGMPIGGEISPTAKANNPSTFYGSATRQPAPGPVLPTLRESEGGQNAG